jgi:Carboxypeptidase regulatory-like domain
MNPMIGREMKSIRVVRELSRVAPLPRRTEGAGKGRRNPLAIPVVPACAACLWVALSLTAFGQATATVGGVIRDSSTGKPVPEAQIIAHSLNKGADHATVSKSDGAYIFINLEPCAYEFEVTKDGFQKSSARVQVGDLQIATVDLPLQLAVESQTAERVREPPLTEREKQMLARIERLEQRLAAMEASASTDARGQQPQQGTLAESPAQPAGNRLEKRPLVASLNPVAAMA